MTEPAPKKRPVFLQIAGIIVLIFTLVTILFSGARSLNRETVEARLKQFSSSLSQAATDNGKEGTFSYGTVALEGWGYNKRAVIQDISLLISDKNSLNASSWILSTPKMQMASDPAVAGNSLFEFPEPISVIKNSQPKATITFPVPLKYGYYEGKVNKKALVAHTLYLPPEIRITPTGETDNSGSVVITYDEHPEFFVKSYPQTGEREAGYKFNNVKVVSDTVQTTMGAFNSHFKQKINADKRAEGDYSLTLVDFTLRNGDKSTQAYTFSTDISYIGDQPKLRADSLTPAMGNADVTINQMLLATDSFKIKGEGKLSANTQESLPWGTMTLTIDHVAAFIQSELIPEPVRPAVALNP